MIHTWPLRDKLFAFVIVLLFSTAALQSAQAGASPPAIGGTCGGQNWHVQAPVDCTKTKTIDGTSVTIHLVQTAAGFEQVTFTLATPRPTDTLVHVTSHVGNSDDGGPFTDPGGIIRAGTLGPVTLTIPQARCGQNDVRAVFNNTRGRVSGPYINNQSCQPVTTTTTVTTTSTTVPSSTTSSTIPPGPTTTSPGPHATSVSSTPVLPPTGNGPASGPVGWFVALGVLGGGVLLVLVSRRRVSA